MRDIKFRVWDKAQKRWHTDWSSLFPWGTHSEDRGKIILDIVPNHFEFNQYTGLKDKNGVEIYEGDILGINKKAVGEIIAMKSNEDFPTGGFTIRYQIPQYPTPIKVSEIYEIIGNIYENPNLLK